MDIYETKKSQLIIGPFEIDKIKYIEKLCNSIHKIKAIKLFVDINKVVPNKLINNNIIYSKSWINVVRLESFKILVSIKINWELRIKINIAPIKYKNKSNDWVINDIWK